jgi:hypothetical protein
MLLDRCRQLAQRLQEGTALYTSCPYVLNAYWLGRLILLSLVTLVGVKDKPPQNCLNLILMGAFSSFSSRTAKLHFLEWFCQPELAQLVGFSPSIH